MDLNEAQNARCVRMYVYGTKYVEAKNAAILAGFFLGIPKYLSNDVLLGIPDTTSRNPPAGNALCRYFVDRWTNTSFVVIGIDHDTVLRWSGWYWTSCAGRVRPRRPTQEHRPYKWSIYILPRSPFYKKQGKLAFSTSCTVVRPHRRLRNDA